MKILNVLSYTLSLTALAVCYAEDSQPTLADILALTGELKSGETATISAPAYLPSYGELPGTKVPQVEVSRQGNTITVERFGDYGIKQPAYQIDITGKK